MNNSQAPLTPAEVLRLLGSYPRRWVGPALLVTLAASVFTFLWPRSWVATQGLMVRNEATTAEPRAPGKFSVDNEMKVTLETILEIAKSRSVLEDALHEVGPPDGYESTNDQPFPNAQDIADLQEAIKLTPPKGAEFGSTEVFYLQVKDRDRSRALALATAVCDRLESRLQQIRRTRADSMIAELENALELAEQDLAASTGKLRQIEETVGSDLVELRILHRSASDTSDLRRKIVEVAGEVRRNQVRQRDDEQLLRLLQKAKENPQHLLAAPTELLVSQPALQRLKDGLVDAQLQTSQLRGRLTDEHPRVRAAVNAELEIKRQLNEEIETALRGIEASLELVRARTELLEGQRDDLQSRLQRLAGLRADYSNLVADVEHQTRLVAEARTRLMTARAERAGAVTSSLLSRIDNPNTGTKPSGPSHAMVVAAGAAGGLIIGIGLLLLSVQPIQPDRRSNRARPGESNNGRADGQDHDSVPSFQRPETIGAQLA